MTQLNPDHIHAVIRAINKGPYFQLLSMPVTKMGTGFSRVEIDISEKHLNVFGGIHGGVYASAIDTAAYWSVYSEIGEDDGLISIDLKLDFLAPISTGKILVKGHRIKVGKTICLAEATIFNQNEKILAHGSSKMMVSTEFQTIGEAFRFVGLDDLPPKFIS